MCSIIPLTGAKPVPPATIIIGLLESSRRKKLPKGASNLKMAFSTSSFAAYSLNWPPGITRICNCKNSLSCGALAIEKARRLPSFKINSMYCPALNCKRSLAGNCRCKAITSCASCSFFATRAGKILGLMPAKPPTSRHSIVKSSSGLAQHKSVFPEANSASDIALP